MWVYFFGYGFIKLFDDFGLYNLFSYFELMNYLVGEVCNGSYNFKEFMKWIILSEFY